MSKTVLPGRITPDDLESKLRALQGDLQARVDDKKSTVRTIGGGLVVVLLVLFFLLGKRSGKKKTTLVEIRRL